MPVISPNIIKMFVYFSNVSFQFYNVTCFNVTPPFPKPDRNFVGLINDAKRIRGNSQQRGACCQVTTVDPGHKQRRDYGTDRKTAKIGAGDPAHLDLGKLQIVDPRGTDYRDADHDRVTNQGHIDANGQRAPVVELSAVVQQPALVSGHTDLSASMFDPPGR
jgi:hypothetical protein